MTEKWIIKNGEVVDTDSNMTFDSFWELLTVLNGQSRHLTELSEENKKLKQVLKELRDMIQYDVSNNIRTYPVKLLEYLVNAIDEIGDFDNSDERCCGHCKHLQIDGMFGMWCDKGHNWGDVKYCSDWER